MKKLTHHIMNHLKVRITEHNEANLNRILEKYDYSPENLRYTIQGGLVYLYVNKGDLNNYYCRTFQVSMLLKEHRRFFIDYTPVIATLLAGDIEYDQMIIDSIEEDWDNLAPLVIISNLTLFSMAPIVDTFDWRIIGEDLFSVETHHSYSNTNYPIYLLDYAYRYMLKNGGLIA